ncbi:MAG TPA: hypothetical protein VKA57_02390 [Solirubrobacteraceae bacterium]|jgi:hypothetical protein|nr:hypothetical protein [Solirubrobacteraceae bacterium]
MADRIPDLDAWLPNATVRTQHRRAVAATPGALWRAAREIRLADTRTLGRLVRWRIPGTPESRTYDQLFRAYPFTVLEEGESHLVSGLCGRIWTLQRDYPRLDGPAAFRAWDKRGTVRVSFAHWVTTVADGRAELCTEARVEPVDRHAAMRLRALWAMIGGFERLVGAEPLRLAARRAQGG